MITQCRATTTAGCKAIAMSWRGVRGPFKGCSWKRVLMVTRKRQNRLKEGGQRRRLKSTSARGWHQNRNRRHVSGCCRWRTRRKNQIIRRINCCDNKKWLLKTDWDLFSYIDSTIAMRKKNKKKKKRRRKRRTTTRRWLLRVMTQKWERRKLKKASHDRRKTAKRCSWPAYSYTTEIILFFKTKEIVDCLNNIPLYLSIPFINTSFTSKSVIILS